jgi:tellurite resistance protein TerC
MIWFWLGFFVFIALLLAFDLGVMHRRQTETTLKSAALWTVAWMTVGLAFGGFIYAMYDQAWLGAKLTKPSASPGSDGALTYVAAYLLEYSLSVDNLFVIALVFKGWRVPPKYQHRVLFWGILGAVVLRVVLLAGGVTLVQQFSWVFYIFGAYLAWAGIKLLRGGDEDNDPTESRAVRMLRRVVPITDADHGGAFVVSVMGRRTFTTLALCMLTILFTDVVFALDSIPAVLSVSDDAFIMATSNVLAVMGLRNLYFLLAGAMNKFQYLQIALGVLLVVIGVKLALHDHLEIPNGVSLALIAGIIGAGVLASVLSKPKPEAA